MNTTNEIVLCPKCSARLSSQNSAQPTLLKCMCGFGSPDPMRLLGLRLNQHLVYIYSVLSIAVLLLAFESHVWGGYVFEIPVLKTRQMLSHLDAKGYERIVEICKKRAQISCVKKTYKEMYVEKRQLEALAGLAEFEVQLHENDAALANFNSYFLMGGKNPKVALQYALALEQLPTLANLEKAIQYLKLSIAQNPEKLSSLATQELLRILVSQQKYEDAQSLIHHFWASAENAKGYFNKEATQIGKILGNRKTAQRAVASSRKI